MIGVPVQAGLGLAAAGAVLFCVGVFVAIRGGWIATRVIPLVALGLCAQGLLFVILGMLMALWGMLCG